MADIKTLLKEYHNKGIAIYGLGTETERFLFEYRDIMSVKGLLDGFKEEGEIYGCPIIPIAETVGKAALIIVVARPGSCKAIAKRIGAFCSDNGIALFDVRGRDLLAATNVAYNFSGFKGCSRQSLLEMIGKAEVVSFDLFDTLITRTVSSYIDIF